MANLLKYFKKFLKGTGLFALATLTLTLGYFFIGTPHIAPNINWGVSFSPPYATSLGLDWKLAYLAILDDLNVSHLRLMSYWPEFEKSQGNYDFSALDFQISEAAKRQKNIVLVLGIRQPRWPECHYPSWTSWLDGKEKEDLALKFVETILMRYKDNPSIKAWQIENEFFVDWFGACPEGNKDFLTREIVLVKSLDNRQIVLTDSGELSFWYPTAKQADIFGTTMYRRVYAPWGVSTWPYLPVYYNRLARLVGAFSGHKRTIVVELQAEPWAKTTLANDSTETNFETLSPAQFEKNIDFARRTGFDEFYLWGAEWWYYMKVIRQVDDFWETAKLLWK